MKAGNTNEDAINLALSTPRNPLSEEHWAAWLAGTELSDAPLSDAVEKEMNQRNEKGNNITVDTVLLPLAEENWAAVLANTNTPGSCSALPLNVQSMQPNDIKSSSVTTTSKALVFDENTPLMFANQEDYSTTPSNAECGGDGNTGRGGDREVAITPAPKVVRLRVAGLCCNKEIKLVHGILDPIKGVHQVRIDIIGRLVIVRYDSSQTNVNILVDSLNQYQLGCTIQAHGTHNVDEGHEALITRQQMFFFGSQLILFFVATFVYFYSSPAVVRRPWLSKALFIAYLTLAVPPIATTAYRALCQAMLDINSLMLIAAASAWALDQNFDAALVIFLFGFASLAEEICLAWVRNALKGVAVVSVNMAVLAGPGQQGTLMKIEDVRIGTRLAVRPGDHVPLDGLVKHGTASLDESSVTGESVPVAKSVGDPVSAGTIVQNGYIEITTTATHAESTVSMIQVPESSSYLLYPPILVHPYTGCVLFSHLQLLFSHLQLLFSHL